MKDEIIKSEVKEIDENETEVVTPEELWFDPLITIETVTCAMFNIAEVDFDGKQLCLDDFGAMLRECNTTIFETLKAYNIKQGFVKPKKKAK